MVISPAPETCGFIPDLPRPSVGSHTPAVDFHWACPLASNAIRAVSTTMSLTPLIASWLRPPVCQLQRLPPSRARSQVVSPFGRTGIAAPSSCPRPSITRAATRSAPHSISLLDSEDCWVTAASWARRWRRGCRPLDLSTRLVLAHRTFDLIGVRSRLELSACPRRAAGLSGPERHPLPWAPPRAGSPVSWAGPTRRVRVQRLAIPRPFSRHPFSQGESPIHPDGNKAGRVACRGPSAGAGSFNRGAARSGRAEARRSGIATEARCRHNRTRCPVRKLLHRIPLL